MLCHYLLVDREIPDFALLNLVDIGRFLSGGMRHKDYLCYLDTNSNEVVIGFTTKFLFMYNEKKRSILGKDFSPDSLLKLISRAKYIESL